MPCMHACTTHRHVYKQKHMQTHTHTHTHSQAHTCTHSYRVTRKTMTKKQIFGPPITISVLYGLTVCVLLSPLAHLQVIWMLWFIFLTWTNQACPLLFILFLCLFLILFTVFHSINSSDHSLLCHSALLVLFLPYWFFQLYVSFWKSPSALL